MPIFFNKLLNYSKATKLNALCTKSILFFLFMLLLLGKATQAQIYVVPTGAGTKDGSSWNNAMDNLQKAIDIAQPGEQIWVTKGLYSSENGFVLKDGVNIYGGFKGNETRLNQRNIKKNFPTLTIKNEGRVIFQPNPFHVKTLVDGFIIKGGRIDSIGGGVYLKDNGALHNCIIEKNRAGILDKHSIGGVYLDGANSEIVCCLIMDNSSTLGNRAIGGSGRIINSFIWNNKNILLSGFPKGIALGKPYVDTLSGKIAGVIAWIDPQNLKHGLIISNIDVPSCSGNTFYSWSPVDEVSGTSKDRQTYNGRENTVILAGKYKGDFAAYRCYYYPNYTAKPGSWYLPSIAELRNKIEPNKNVINTACRDPKIGGSPFKNGYYCSSTEHNFDGIWVQDFDSDYPVFYKKRYNYYVRAVMEF